MTGFYCYGETDIFYLNVETNIKYWFVEEEVWDKAGHFIDPEDVLL